MAILVVDDHAPFRRAVSAVARAAGHATIAEADAGSDAIHMLELHGPGPVLALIDVNLGAESGIDLARTVSAGWPDATIVLVSTMDERDLPADAADCGAMAFVPKSRLDPARLSALITTAAGV